ncbi:MAG: hypothetical protein ACLQU2_33830 [Candidatus Binataceae bacterium]
MNETQIIEQAVQKLINTKHLYQSIEVDFRPAVRDTALEMHARREAIKPKSSRFEFAERDLLADLDRREWGLGDFVPGSGIIAFSLPPVRTLCSVCDNVEPFDLSQGNRSVQTISLGTSGEQLFILPLRCQGCRSNLIVFLVSRKGRKIQIVGRSEFEEIKVPDYVNRRERKFYSDAVIAFNCGQVLPAIFMLRTLIEQHMRRVTECSDINIRGDALCDLYNRKLAEDFVARFPSFKVIYGKLSAALHSANADEALFESQLQNICLHLQGLDVYGKTRPPAPKEK